MKEQTADIGIIIGRFQVHELHEAHRGLIDEVARRHDKVFVFIGLSPLRSTTRNPLDFNSRKKLFQEVYPDIDVYYVEDCRSDEQWSINLDREIQKWIKPSQTVMLYGSRDSFIDHYHGKFPTTELETTAFISGTEIRRRISNNFPSTKEFRAGAISATFNRFPTCYTTVDVAIVDYDRKRILVGRKKDEKGVRFIGGFADNTSPSFETDARREVEEETGVSVHDPIYIGSLMIDDWRYRDEVDKIKTLFFVAGYMAGRPEAADDIAEVMWISFQEIGILEPDGSETRNIQFVEEHLPLVKMLQKFMRHELEKSTFHSPAASYMDTDDSKMFDKGVI